MKGRSKDITDFVSNPAIKAELEAYMRASTHEEKERVLKQQRDKTASLSEEDLKSYQQQWKDGMKEVLEGSLQELDEYKSRRTKDLLGKAPQAISLSYIAKTYFGKSKEWLYQRINGNTVNGKPAHFTEEETRQLQDALHDLGMQLLKIRLL